MAHAHITRSPSIRSEPAGVPLDEFLALGADQDAEVIDGELIMISPQKLKNTLMAFSIAFSIGKFIEGKNLGVVSTEITYAPDIDDRKRRVRGSLVPDVGFISQERYAQQLATYGEDDFLRIAPDLAVEIVSPDDKYSELNRKIELYLQYGTRLLWVIDPKLQHARRITPKNPAGQIVTIDKTLSGDPVLPGWSISLKELLAGGK